VKTNYAMQASRPVQIGLQMLVSLNVAPVQGSTAFTTAGFGAW
jgi:hypothetical protein